MSQQVALFTRVGGAGFLVDTGVLLLLIPGLLWNFLASRRYVFVRVDSAGAAPIGPVSPTPHCILSSTGRSHDRG